MQGDYDQDGAGKKEFLKENRFYLGWKITWIVLETVGLAKRLITGFFGVDFRVCLVVVVVVVFGFSCVLDCSINAGRF